MGSYLSFCYFGTTENVCDKIWAFMNIFLLATGTDTISGEDFYLHFVSLSKRINTWVKHKESENLTCAFSAVN